MLNRSVPVDMKLKSTQIQCEHNLETPLTSENTVPCRNTGTLCTDI